MSDSFRQQVLSNLRFFEQPDYTAKGDTVIWFKNNAAAAHPILMELAETGDKTAKAMLDVVQGELSLEEQIRAHLALFEVPDYTAKGDAANFFTFNAAKVIPVLEKLAAADEKGAAEMLRMVRKVLEQQQNQRSYKDNNPDYF